MKKRYLSSFFKVILVVLMVVGAVSNLYADVEKRIVLQGFWWDYWNNNYENAYANYLTELAPRLREIGVNAILIPGFQKNTGTNSNGYSPFDNYDLGDKYQKGTVYTRFGTKDDLLRCIAVMHANGIEVIADAVLNHVDGAGGDNGAGGEDPNAWNGKWKNFRYVCYKTPHKTGDAKDYLSREGRWPKNWENFHPNEGHNCSDGDWCSDWWGPDICYYEGAYGQSSNAIYNPAQGPNYMTDNAREWMKWMKKQTNVDGYRWDAVKHFPYWTQQDISWNMKYGIDWACGGETMFNVGEYIGGTGEIDAYIDNVTNANGGSDFLMGAYDFPLCMEIKNVVDGGGYGDIGAIPSKQLWEGHRIAYYGDGDPKAHRPLNYLNSHDSFRPKFDDKGNYAGWDTEHETPGHTDPFNWRLGMAYATLAAMDGNLLVYFEDLFNLSNSNRYTHHPASATELPVRESVKNVIWAHQNLNFKWGDYKVRCQEGDLLIIERSGRALICLTDDGSNNWHNKWVKTDFAPGTVLKDYSGGADGNPVVNGDGWVELWVRPVTDDGSSKSGRGYAVWAPEGGGGFAPYRSTTTVQEWEMADDLGDSNCQSLGQGGALPKGSTNQRLVGKIYVDKGKKANFHAYMASSKDDVTLAIYDLDGNLLQKKSGVQEFDFDYTPTKAGWIAMKIWNNSKSAEGGKAYIKASYIAPATVTNTMSDRADTRASVWTGNMGTSTWNDCGNWEQGKVPNASSTVVIPDNGDVQPIVSGSVTIKELVIEKGTGSTSTPEINVTGSLKVTTKTTVKEGEAYICGNATLGTVTGKVNNCTVSAETLEDESDFTIYPSPATEYLTITSSFLPKDEILFYNATYQLVKSVKMEETIERVDLSDLPAGVYMVTDGTHSKRFIKK